ncbi:MAG: DNA primase small subunit PriS [Thermoplasmatales archaeon]|jgi:DNA primase small subunit|nr:DNA primase small subunit PriS [Candidatus Thermoplasmatota archaeon]MCL6002760.1 DNA primase small subunit PriS [Candidatus Thermoplasmatota archaeon]MDA8054863.1 DNA primase small subunit PriS [Thermoplasmatales archaeon]
MNELSGRVVLDLFKRYYEEVNSFEIRRIEKRELAFTSFGKQGMVRHTSFQSMNALVDYVRDNTPSHFYYSSAYYNNPEASMENKRWTGADLVFDIDGDHIEGAEKMGYGEMLSVVKEELKKLLVILTDDLSVGKQNMEIVFSGSRGYHVHVYTIFEGLESQERREIVDYISGRCISSEFRSTARTKWDDKINGVKESLLQIIDSTDKKWKQKLEEVTGETTGELNKREIRKDNYIDRNARKLAVKRFSSKIDEPVTIDIHRLIRTPGSLHGKSGLTVMVLPYDRVDDFDPLREAIPKAFDDNSEVIITKNISLELGGTRLDLQEGNTVLPTYAALYSVLKGSAEFTAHVK